MPRADPRSSLHRARPSGPRRSAAARRRRTARAGSRTGCPPRAAAAPDCRAGRSASRCRRTRVSSRVSVISVEVKRYSFQLKKNATTPTATMPGIESGRTMRQSTPMSPEPSTRAASSTSSGSAENRRIRIHTPIGRMNAACRSATAHRCPVRSLLAEDLEHRHDDHGAGHHLRQQQHEAEGSLPRQRRRDIA